MTLILLMLVEGALGAVGFATSANKPPIDLIGCPSHPLLRFSAVIT